MSAESKARSISRTEGLDRVRALQRVLYRSAKQEVVCACSAMNDVGEPCAGEQLHARFEGGREATRCRWPQGPRAGEPPHQIVRVIAAAGF